MSDYSHIEARSHQVRQPAQDSAGGDVERPGPFSDGLWEPADLIHDRYRLRARLGRGRLGHIYEASDEASVDVGAERRVAIQLVDKRLAADPDFLGRLMRGCTALRAGPHPNIVELLDFGHDENACFLVMELLEGASLRFVLDDAGALPSDEATAAIRAAGDALRYLHTKSVLHGRVAPESVFVTYDYQLKLLDTVPLIPPSAIPGEGYALDPDATGTPDVRDDVYGLACLAYELIAGRHPFNSNLPSEARRAGLEPAPTDSMSARQWHALTRGLAFEREQRTPTIAEFLRQFGVTGTERLQTSDDSGPASLPSASAADASTFPIDGAAPPASIGQPTYDDARTDVGDRRDWHRALPEPADTRRGSIGHRGLFALVGAIVVGAGVWAYQDRLREGALELFAAVDSGRAEADRRAGDELEEIQIDGSPVASLIDRSESALPFGPAPVSNAADAAQAAPAGESAALQRIGPATDIEPISAPSSEAGTSADSSAATGATIAPPAPQTTNDDPGQPQANNEITFSGELPRDAAVASMPADEPAISGAATAGPADTAAAEFAFARSAVSVSEGGGAVRIDVQRSGNTAMPDSVVWWTSDQTAVADEDYVPVAEQVEEFAAGEQSRSLYVPLINDSLPERQKSFYVYIGRHAAQQGQLETISSIRVDIVDDD